MSEIQGVVNQAKMYGHKKVAGEHSLTVGEVLFTLIGVLIVFGYASRFIPRKYALWAGLGVIFAGEWLF